MLQSNPRGVTFWVQWTLRHVDILKRLWILENDSKFFANCSKASPELNVLFFRWASTKPFPRINILKYFQSEKLILTRLCQEHRRKDCCVTMLLSKWKQVSSGNNYRQDTKFKNSACLARGSPLSGSENRRIGELYVALKCVKVFSVVWLLCSSCPAPVSLVCSLMALKKA